MYHLLGERRKCCICVGMANSILRRQRWNRVPADIVGPGIGDVDVRKADIAAKRSVLRTEGVEEHVIAVPELAERRPDRLLAVAFGVPYHTQPRVELKPFGAVHGSAA